MLFLTNWPRDSRSLNLTFLHTCTHFSFLVNIPVTLTQFLPYINLVMKCLCTFSSLSPTDHWRQDSPRLAHQELLPLMLFLRKTKMLRAASWQSRPGEGRPFKRMLRGRRLNCCWAKIPCTPPSSPDQMLRQVASWGVPRQAVSDWSGRMAWKWMSSVPLGQMMLCS